MAVNLDMYATGLANEPEEDEEEKNAAGNHKQPERNPVGRSQVRENEDVPTSAKSTLGIHKGAAERFKNRQLRCQRREIHQMQEQKHGNYTG